MGYYSPQLRGNEKKEGYVTDMSRGVRTGIYEGLFQIIQMLVLRDEVDMSGSFM